jgi:hypothetical protein
MDPPPLLKEKRSPATAGRGPRERAAWRGRERLRRETERRGRERTAQLRRKRERRGRECAARLRRERERERYE